MEFVNITGSAATQNRPTGLHCSLLYDSIVFSCCLLYFTLMFFALFAANFVIFSLLATILLNLNLNLTPKYINWEDSSAAFGLPLILLDLSRKKGLHVTGDTFRIHNLLYGCCHYVANKDYQCSIFRA